MGSEMCIRDRIFGVALLTEMPPCELAFLKMSQFRKQRLNGSDTWVIKGIIGDSNGTCKNSKGGIKAVKRTPKEVTVFNITQLDGLVNVYHDIERYMNIRRTITLAADKNDRFFLGINGGATRFSEFIKRLVTSKTQVRRVVQMAA